MRVREPGTVMVKEPAPHTYEPALAAAAEWEAIQVAEAAAHAAEEAALAGVAEEPVAAEPVVEEPVVEEPVVVVEPTPAPEPVAAPVRTRAAPAPAPTRTTRSAPRSR